MKLIFGKLIQKFIGQKTKIKKKSVCLGSSTHYCGSSRLAFSFPSVEECYVTSP